MAGYFDKPLVQTHVARWQLVNMPARGERQTPQKQELSGVPTEREIRDHLGYGGYWVNALAIPRDRMVALVATQIPGLGRGLCFAHRIDLRVVLFIYNEISILRDVIRSTLWHPT